MNNHMPRTPLSTHLSRSARETEIRIRNIFSGPKKRPPVPLMILVAALCIFCGNIVSCQIAEPADVSEPASSAQGDRSAADRDARLNEMVLDYLRAEYDETPETFYLAEDAPDPPQDLDRRLDSVRLIGMDYYEEDLYVLYQVDHSLYLQGRWEPEWRPSSDFLVSRMDGQRDLEEVIGRTFYHGPEEDMSTDSAIQGVKDTIRQAIWGLDEFEVSLYREGYPIPLGLGNWVELFPEAEPEVEVQEGYYFDDPGDRFVHWSVDGLTAQRYYSAAGDRYHLFALDTTRSDLYTPRGIRVGSTREQVREAYPTAKVTDGWWKYAGEDILLYDPDPTGEGRVWLLFLFDGDVVKQITLYSAFN